LWEIELGGCRVRVRFSFLLVNSLIFLVRDPALIWGFYAVCLLHELGHVLAAELTGGRVTGIDLRWTGFFMTVSRQRIPALWQEILVLLSGPAVNLLMAVLLYFQGATGSLFRVSLWEGLLNLLPFSGLDGGAALELFALGRPNERALLRLIGMAKIAAAGGILAAVCLL